MPRPRKCRKVCCLPKNLVFTPETPSDEAPVLLTVDEYETLRLIDKEGFSQEECGGYMDIARATVQQIYTSARKKVADALVNGRTIRITGGDYRLCDGKESYCRCGGCRKHRLNCMRATVQKEKHMKVMIPLDENKMDVCPTFARAPYFLCGDENQVTILENPAADAQGGAGLQAAQFVVDQEVTALVTVRCGQNAADIFKVAQVKIYEAQGKDAKQNLAACLNGALAELTHFHAGFQGIQ